MSWGFCFVLFLSVVIVPMRGRDGHRPENMGNSCKKHLVSQAINKLVSRPHGHFLVFVDPTASCKNKNTSLQTEIYIKHLLLLSEEKTNSPTAKTKILTSQQPKQEKRKKKKIKRKQSLIPYKHFAFGHTA